MTDTETLFLECWDWHTWMRNGSMPPDPDHTLALAWLRGFAAGRWTQDEFAAIMKRARPIEKFHDPSTWVYPGPVPSHYTRLQRS